MPCRQVSIAAQFAHNGRMRHDHDASYKQLFSYPEVVRDLVLGFIPDQWLHSLDFDTLEKVPGSFVTEDLRHRSGDVVWRVKVHEQWMYLYLLIEFQSRVDRWMAVRIMTYVGLLYQDLIRRGHINAPQQGKRRKRPATAQLPPVLPIVIYNGERGWTAATDVAELIPTVPGVVDKYVPRMKYLLIDESTQAKRGETLGLHNLMAAIVRIEHPASSEALVHIIDQLDSWLDYNSEVRRTLAVWIRSVILRKSKYRVTLPEVTDLKELKMTVTNRFDQWTREWEQQGIEKGLEKGLEKGRELGVREGIEKGEALLLQRQLARRFGPLPDAVLQRISNASSTELELWGDRVLDAASLDDVFA